MKHQGTKIIETERLILRPFVEEDILPAYRNWCSDDKVTKYLRWPTHTDSSVTERVLKDWIANYQDPSFYQWAIELKSIHEPIGSIAVVDMKQQLDIVHIGYCIGSQWWHKGITTEALQAVIPFLFDEVEANRIESMHDPNNPHSGCVMLKCGMTFEGTLRQSDFNNQGIVDVCMYSIIRDEYEAMK